MSGVMVYPVPDAAAIQEDFIIRVRSGINEEWTAVPAYQVKVDMHEVRTASMAYFDFEGKVEVEILCERKQIYQVDIRPLSCGIKADYDMHRIRFCLEEPKNLSIEVNNERFHNLHLFAGRSIEDVPRAHEMNVHVLKGNLSKVSIHRSEDLSELLAGMPKGRTLYFEPGIHYLEECCLKVPSDTNVYLAGGAVVIGSFICSEVENVRIYGKGVLCLAEFKRFTGLNGIRISHCKNIRVEDIIIINPPHYTVYIGGSDKINIKRIKGFSCEGWSDGIDIMSSQEILVEGVFLRNSDDCIAIYGSRWDYKGASRHLVIRDCVLWADVAHPINIGTHGNYLENGDTIEDIYFHNIDILEHHEAQAEYLGCMAINAGDKNMVRNVTYEKIRVEPFEHGKLLDVQVKWNKDYNPTAGRRIENISFIDITYDGTGEVTSQISGYDEERYVKDIMFKNIKVNGTYVNTLEEANIHVGNYAYSVRLLEQSEKQF